MVSEHAGNKQLVAAFLSEIAAASDRDMSAIIARYCADDVVWKVFHPFNTLVGADAGRERFWRPLQAAFPDYEIRAGAILGGSFEERDFVSVLGHVQGTFAAPFVGIPATQGLTFLRFGMNAIVRDRRIVKAYILLDIIDVMRQAGFYPFRRAPGSPEQWPFPPAASGGSVDRHDGDLGERTIRNVREMQMGLVQGDQLKDLASARKRHSPHWHKNMNWYGPAGIGSCRGQRGFLDFHGALFLQAFPDRAGFVREPHGEEDRPGHFIRIGDGRLAVTNGWPSLHATHLGGAWLGLPPSGKRVEMRVADWYRTDTDDRIVDNWVMMDIPHILDQIGLDIFDDLRYFADPALPRWPL